MYSSTDLSVSSFFQNSIVSLATVSPSFKPILYRLCSSCDSSNVVMNSLFITIMSIFDRYRVNSVYVFKIVPTNALTEIPNLSASLSKTSDKSRSNLKDLVIVSERASERVIRLKLLTSRWYSPR